MVLPLARSKVTPGQAAAEACALCELAAWAKAAEATETEAASGWTETAGSAGGPGGSARGGLHGAAGGPGGVNRGSALASCHALLLVNSGLLSRCTLPCSLGSETGAACAWARKYD